VTGRPYGTIRYEREGYVGILSLARPDRRNAQNPTMWRELADLGTRLQGDGSLRCLVIAGDGPSFSAGIDLFEGLGGAVAESTGSLEEDRSRDAAVAAAGTFAWIPRLDVPSVAAVHGHAIGAGLQLALACDFRVFSEGAKVGLAETRYGLLPDMGATVRLPRIIGEGRARELILLGDVIDAPEAVRIGLANRVVPDDELRAVAMELAERLAAQPPLAIAGARRAIDAAWHRSADDSFAVAVDEQLHCLASEDFKEGLAAFGEGRAPEWQGR
jgi:enoyl-CoA hydratase/carnithine racemase